MALMRAGQELAHDPALALHFGEANEMADLSIVGLIANACETAAEAFEQLGRYGRLIIDVEVDDGGAAPRPYRARRASFWLIDTRQNPNDFPELTESTFARMILPAAPSANADCKAATSPMRRRPIATSMRASSACR